MVFTRITGYLYLEMYALQCKYMIVRYVINMRIKYEAEELSNVNDKQN